MSGSGHFRPSSAGFPYRPLPLSPKSGHSEYRALGACQIVRDALAKYLKINDYNSAPGGRVARAPMKSLSVSLNRLDQMLRVRIRQNFRIQAGECSFERLTVDFCDSHA